MGTILGLYSVFGLFNFAKTGEISTWWAVLYAFAGRLCFAISLGWVTFACEANHGSNYKI